MDIQGFAILILVVIAAFALGYFIDKGRSARPEKVPIADLLKNITDEILAANQNAMTRGSTVMLFQECELEIAFKTELSADEKLSVYALDLSGGVKLTESNKMTLKYISYAQNPMSAVAQAGAPEITPGNP